MRTNRNYCIFQRLSIGALLVASLVAFPAVAQERPAPPPDAPSATVASDEAVLKKHSTFFPDLAASRAPLSVDGKFRLFIKDSVAPSSILFSAFGAGINQADDRPTGYGQGAEGYFKRFGSALATQTMNNFFGGFIIASMAHEDPRYFVHGKGTFGQRAGHAISRVVVAPRDKGGYGFNWGGVFGPLSAEAFANTYLPVHEQTGARTMSRYGVDLAVSAGGKVLREFWPDIFKHLGLSKSRQ